MSKIWLLSIGVCLIWYAMVTIVLSQNTNIIGIPTTPKVVGLVESTFIIGGWLVFLYVIPTGGDLIAKKIN